MEYPIQLCGYLNEQEEPTCMVSNVTKDTEQELNQLHGLKVDEWFLSSNRCGDSHSRQQMKPVKQQEPNTV